MVIRTGRPSGTLLQLDGLEVHVRADVADLGLRSRLFGEADGALDERLDFGILRVVVDERQGLGRAVFDAGGQTPFGETMGAERAVLGLAGDAHLMGLGLGLEERLLVAEVSGPAVLVEAGGQAHPAADALLVVDEHFTVRPLGDRLCGADLHACGILAVLARDAIVVDDALSDILDAADLVPLNARSDLVFFLAGHKAGFAADAAVYVENDAVATHCSLLT